jgi:GNAT superfamily N-acetyltransferase
MKELVISIRRAKSEDAAALSSVFDAAWREAYQGIIPSIALERMISRRGPRWWLSTIGRCRDRSLPADGEIDELYLAPEYQGVGFGKRLFKAVRNDLADRDIKRIIVWSLADNERACAFYQGMGGRRIKETTERIGGANMGKAAFLFN